MNNSLAEHKGLTFTSVISDSNLWFAKWSMCPLPLCAIQGKELRHWGFFFAKKKQFTVHTTSQRPLLTRVHAKTACTQQAIVIYSVAIVIYSVAFVLACLHVSIVAAGDSVLTFTNWGSASFECKMEKPRPFLFQIYWRTLSVFHNGITWVWKMFYGQLNEIILCDPLDHWRNPQNILCTLTERLRDLLQIRSLDSFFVWRIN